MADNIQQPEPPNYGYGIYKNLPGTGGISSHPDTFIGPYDKTYADFIARNLTRLRGSNAYYYVKADHELRIDGDVPLADNAAIVNDALARKRHAGMALYGEHVIVGEPLDTVRHEVIPDWPYEDPILVRGLVYELEHDNDSDERGAIFARGGRFDLARVLCDREWNIRPRTGDVVRFTEKIRGYYDIEDIDTEETRWGSTGFFVVYKCTIRRNTKFEPQRKIAEQKKTSDEEIMQVQDNEPLVGKVRDDDDPSSRGD